MTDFDKEFELLAEYITYRIDWRIAWFKSRVTIELKWIAKLDAEDILKHLRQTGILFINTSNCDNANVSEITSNGVLSFEDWKLKRLNK